MSLDYTELGKRIRKIREERDLPQNEVAARAGVSIQHYGNIERGQTKVSLEALVRVANVLEVGLDQLLADSVYRSKAVFCDDLAKLVANATDAELRAIVQIARTSLSIIREEYRERNSWE
ncbi:MAG: helix-turn-helix transcriptional regulator [Clostridiales bacterium]|nr:helix-turn-helix transcriptional regulator [Clostridiales bacterium]